MLNDKATTLKEEVLSVLTEAYPEETEHLLEVTTAAVRRDGRAGQGAILGDEPAKTLLLACLDLLDPAGQAAARERLAPHLARLARRAEAVRGLEARMSGSTRVEFQSMAGE